MEKKISAVALSWHSNVSNVVKDGGKYIAEACQTQWHWGVSSNFSFKLSRSSFDTCFQDKANSWNGRGKGEGKKMKISFIMRGDAVMVML